MDYFLKGFIVGFTVTLMTVCSPTLAQELLADEEGVLPEEVHRTKPVECYTAESVVAQSEQAGMIAFWQGPNQKDQLPDNTIVIFVHPDTNGWVAVEMNMEAACILGYGQSFWMFNQFYQHLDKLDLLEQDTE